jgi:hypothetical protein
VRWYLRCAEASALPQKLNTITTAAKMPIATITNAINRMSRGVIGHAAAKQDSPLLRRQGGDQAKRF